MLLQSLPVLITSGDLLPGGGELNGRRWAGQQFLRCWASRAGTRPMALAHADPSQLEQLKPWLESQGFSCELHPLGLLDPEPCRAWGGFFLPDPSIGRWAQWRQPVGSAAFSLIGQIHTLSTPAALGHLQDLVTEPVQPWDALIAVAVPGEKQWSRFWMPARSSSIGELGLPLPDCADSVLSCLSYLSHYQPTALKLLVWIRLRLDNS